MENMFSTSLRKFCNNKKLKTIIRGTIKENVCFEFQSFVITPIRNRRKATLGAISGGGGGQIDGNYKLTVYHMNKVFFSKFIQKNFIVKTECRNWRG